MALAPHFNAWTRLWSGLTRGRMEREVAEELDFHVRGSIRMQVLAASPDVGGDPTEVEPPASTP